MRHLTFLLFCAAALLTMRAHAQSLQPLSSIEGAAESYVRAQLPKTQSRYYVTAAHLDSRLRLAQCSAPLDALPNSTNSLQTARITVGVRCAAQTPWTVYVPVSVEVEASVLVLRRSLPRRAPILATDVELQVHRLPGTASTFLSDVNNLNGHRLKRAIPAGTPLTVELLVPDVVVRRGQQVTLVAANGGIEIRAQGLVLADAGAADRVRVQNVSSLKVIEGVVENENVVRVGL
jgi:flagella basal body P-ring formation protein FlgA